MSHAVAAPEIVVDEKSHDFGILYSEEHQTVTHRFEFQNVGDATLTIQDIKTSCGCTRAEMAKREIPPGESATLVAELQFRDHRFKDSIRISLMTNDPAHPVFEVGLTGFLLRHWILEPPSIEEIVAVTGQTTERAVSVVSNQLLEEAPWEILSISSDHPQLAATLGGKPKVESKQGFRMTQYSLGVRIAGGESPSLGEQGTLYLRTSDPAYPVLRLPVRWLVEGDLTLSTRNVYVLRSRLFRPPPTAGDQDRNRRKVVVASRSKTPFRITSVDLGPPFAVEWDRERVSDTAELILSITGEKAQHAEGTLSIHTDREREPVHQVRVRGEAQEIQAIFSAPTTQHHFGNILKGEAKFIERTFTVSNLGTRPLDLCVQEVHETDAKLSGANLPPGASAAIALRADLSRKEGAFDLWATIASNDPTKATETFRLTGLILPPWRLEPSTLSFRTVQPNEEEERMVSLRQVFPSWKKPLIPQPSQTDNGEVAIRPGKTMATYDSEGLGHAETEISVVLTPRSSVSGKYSVSIPIQVNEPGARGIPPLRVEWQILGDLRARPSPLVFFPKAGGAANQKPTRLKLYSKGSLPFAIKGVQAPENVSISEIERHPTSISYEVRLLSELKGEPTIRFQTDRPGEPEIEVGILVSEGREGSASVSAR